MRARPSCGPEIVLSAWLRFGVETNMGKAHRYHETLMKRIQMISDLGDAALITAALQGFANDDLRTACRLRPDIPKTQISCGTDGRKVNKTKKELVVALAQSLLIDPAKVTLSTAQKWRIRSRDGSCKRDHKSPSKKRQRTKNELEPRVMATLIRSLGPLWQEMVQADTEFLEGNYPRFHGYDGLVMLGAQLKHPSLATLFLDSLES